MDWRQGRYRRGDVERSTRVGEEHFVPFKLKLAFSIYWWDACLIYADTQ